MDDISAKRYQEARAAFEAAEQDLKTLQDRARSYADQATALKAELIPLEEKRQELVSAVALGRADSSDLAKVKESIRDKEAQAREFEEMEQAVKRELYKFKQKLCDAEKEALAAWRGHWQAIQDAALEEALTMDVEPLFRAFCAERKDDRVAHVYGGTTLAGFSKYVENKFVPRLISRLEEYRSSFEPNERPPKSHILGPDDHMKADKFNHTTLTLEQAWGLEPKPNRA